LFVLHTGEEDYITSERQITFEIEDRQMQIMALIVDNNALESAGFPGSRMDPATMAGHHRWN